MEIGIVVDDKEILKQLAGLEGQVRFATSLALNNTANEFQRTMQDSLASKFTLRRRDFIRNTIKRESGDKATKERLVAVVRVDPKRDLLVKFEEGETKVGRGGHRIALPTENVRRTKSEVIGTAQRPRSLLNPSVSGRSAKAFLKAGLILRSVGRGARAVVQTLYVLKRSVKIPKRLGFITTASATVDRSWAKHAAAAVERAIATMR